MAVRCAGCWLSITSSIDKLCSCRYGGRGVFFVSVEMTRPSQPLSFSTYRPNDFANQFHFARHIVRRNVCCNQFHSSTLLSNAGEGSERFSLFLFNICHRFHCCEADWLPCSDFLLKEKHINWTLAWQRFTQAQRVPKKVNKYIVGK